VDLTRSRGDSPEPQPTRAQRNRISKQAQKLVEIGIVPSSTLKLAAQGLLGGISLHDVQRDLPQNRDVVWAVAQSALVLMFIRHDIEPPVQAAFDIPMLADNLVEAFARQCRAEQ
jgi:hypothetical protein